MKSMSAPDLTQFVNVNGQPIIPMGPSFTTQKIARSDGFKPVTNRADAKESSGFRVVGHPPGVMEAARASAEKACAEWFALDDEIRAARLREGLREPKPWDEEDWRAKSKPKAVRSKPYELASAADQCADLARKSGWIDVRVVELLRG